jgi:hypothetical protein
MFAWFSDSVNPAVEFLKRDHEKVKDLFEKFEDAKTRAAKKRIAVKALAELRVHAAIEEEIFYPAVRVELDRDLMNEADEEHHVAKLLIAELSKMSGKEEHFAAKFHVLAESVRHHIKEEESEMLPKAQTLAIDYDALGQQMLDRKRQLQARGVPKSAEDRIATNRADSPAKASRKTRRAPKSRAA